jgi:hypothetical protein
VAALILPWLRRTFDTVTTETWRSRAMSDMVTAMASKAYHRAEQKVIDYPHLTITQLQKSDYSLNSKKR